MFDACICDRPDEMEQLLSRSQRVARKPHECGECGHTIDPGDTYEVDATVFDGEFCTHKTCLPCVRVRDSMFACGWVYGEVWRDIHEQYCRGAPQDECICPEAESKEA